MIRLSCALLLICSLALPVVADGRPERSRAQVRAFLRQQGLERTPEGYEVDHIVPLCAGGKDAPENMQLLTREQHREKTRHDLRRCWKLREGKKMKSSIPIMIPTALIITVIVALIANIFEMEILLTSIPILIIFICLFIACQFDELSKPLNNFYYADYNGEKKDVTLNEFINHVLNKFKYFFNESIKGIGCIILAVSLVAIGTAFFSWIGAAGTIILLLILILLKQK